MDTPARCSRSRGAEPGTTAGPPSPPSPRSLNGKRLAVRAQPPAAFPSLSRRAGSDGGPVTPACAANEWLGARPSPDSVPLRGDSCAGAGVLRTLSLEPWSRAGSAAGAADIAVVKRRRATQCGISRSGSAGGFGYNRQEERPICHRTQF